MMDFRVRIYFALISCREIENPKEELIDNKGEIIHIYNKSDGMGQLGRSSITNNPITILTSVIVNLPLLSVVVLTC